MRSWGVCHDCGNGLLMAEPDRQSYRCHWCGNTVTVEEIEKVWEAAHETAVARDADGGGMFYDLIPGLERALELREASHTGAKGGT